MPKTLFALLISGLALCGLPPSAGFMGKWQLGIASAASSPLGHAGIAMLMISAVLTVLYIFSIFSIFIMPGKNFDFKTANQGVKDPGISIHLHVPPPDFPSPLMPRSRVSVQHQTAFHRPKANPAQAGAQ